MVLKTFKNVTGLGVLLLEDNWMFSTSYDEYRSWQNKAKYIDGLLGIFEMGDREKESWFFLLLTIYIDVWYWWYPLKNL